MTENECVNKQAILDAIIAAEPKEENYQLVSSKGYVCETVFVKAHSLWQNIVDIIEATQPTECKPVVRGEWQDDDINCNVIGVSPVKCSVCGKINAITIWTQFYCGYCGARMKELESEEEE